MKRTLRTVLVILILGLMLGGLSLTWQTTTQAQQNQAPGFTPSTSPASSAWDAYRNASRIADSQKRIEALEKVTVDFPQEPVTPKAHQMIINILVKNSPGQKDLIFKHIQQAIETTPEFGKATVCDDIATSLIDAGVLLDKAAELADQALALSTTRFKDTNEIAMRSANFTHDALQGLIYLKQGRTKEAEKTLLSAYNVYTPANVGGIVPASMFKWVACGLAEVAEKDGKIEKALDYLLTVSTLGKIDARLFPEKLLLGKIDAIVTQQLEQTYRRAHHDSLAGLEEIIDARYEKEFPLPVRPQPYKPTAARSDRTVLAEVFTGAGCVPCVAADLSMDAFLERYQRQDVIVLMYHIHAPVPDPMANPSTKAYAKYYNVRGVPTVEIDGKVGLPEGGGGRDQAKEVYNKLQPLIDRELEVKAEAEIKLEAKMANSVIQVAAQVKPTKADASHLKLQIALVEDRLRFSGENRVRFHPMVVRSLAGEKAGGLALTGKSEVMTWKFDLKAITQELKQHLDDLEKDWKGETYSFAEKKHVMDPNHLLVVAFVQDEQTKQVLQAASLKVNSSGSK